MSQSQKALWKRYFDFASGSCQDIVFYKEIKGATLQKAFILATSAACFHPENKEKPSDTYCSLCDTVGCSKCPLTVDGRSCTSMRHPFFDQSTHDINKKWAFEQIMKQYRIVYGKLKKLGKV